VLSVTLTRSAAMQIDDAGEVSRSHSTSPADGRAESLMQGADMVFSDDMER